MGIADSDLEGEIASVDSGNSTTSNLGSGASFTGAWTDILLYNNITVNLLSDQSSATSGLSIQWSNNGSTLHSYDSASIVANTGFHQAYARSARYYRVVYTNGSIAQTSFSLQVVLTRGSLATPTLTSGQLVPTITNKLRIRTNVGNVLLPNTNAYQTLYSRSGTGLFFGFQTKFNHAKINVRLTIDGGVIFTLNVDDIKQFEFNDTTDGRVQMGGFLTTIGNVLDFSSRFAIPYATSILLEAASSDGANHNNENWMVIQTEDT